ncbi:Z1 domain-containing protein [Pyxidicoccus trucidator]|uniref:Z1 domain-containing protein n=1 Tax=Pyxidicoccus trucidator TaxID=2709662 RepID=UPI0013DBA900|nr:Z1 domain-containing protein [Pyxidicoccus trucidator]
MSKPVHPQQSTRITQVGDLFNEYLESIASSMGDTAAAQTRETAISVVSNCVSAYVEAFGEGRVGKNASGKLAPKAPGESSNVANVTGLLYGKVQSGKTNTSMATVALALENGFRCFVVLTSDNTLLGTLIAKDFKDQLASGPVVYDWEEWHTDPKEFGKRIRQDSRLEDTGVVFITTKNTHHLKNLSVVLREARARNFPALILDDEADNASLDTTKASRSRGNEIEPGATYARIGDIRKELVEHVYLQITATPQSLFLQAVDDPCKPRFCVMSKPGDGYVGGRDFFSEDSVMQREVDPDEFDALRSGKITVGTGPRAPRGLRDALTLFFLGCAQMRLQDPSLVRFSFLAHIDITRVNHGELRTVINDHVTWLDKSLRGRLSASDTKDAEADLARACDDLKKTTKGLRPLNELRKSVERSLRNVRAEIINSDTGGQQVPYQNGPNIFVGGNRLSRGVRIDNLMVTYYGRDAKVKLMDTVHQHARMFGYREKLRATTRLFSTRAILDSFKIIHDADEGLREAIGQDPTNLELKPVWIGPKLKPTRANVLNPFELGVVLPGRNIYPWCPKYKATEVVSLTKELDSLLEGYEDKKYHDVSVSFIAKILALTPGEERDGWIWTDGRVREILRALEGTKIGINRGLLHISTKKGAGHEVERKIGTPTDTADGKELAQAKKLYGQTVPILFLRKQRGTAKKYKWDDCPFYAPTLALPRGKFAFMFSNV